VYYSGHGTISQSGETQGHTLDGTSFNIEHKVRNLSMRTNVSVIAMFECCRVELKGFLTEKVAGQLAIIYVTQIGRSAVGSPDINSCSPVTREFLEVMKQTSLTFPWCIQNWAKTHKTVQLTDKIRFEIPLKVGTEEARKQQILATVAKKNPIVDKWTPEHTYMWVYSQDQFKGYADQFLKNDITGETLLVLTDGNLKNDLGIDKLGHRIAFLNLVQTLNPEKITKVEEVRKAKEKQEAEERKAKEQQKAEEVRKAEEARKAKEKQKEEVRKAEERRVEEFKKVVNRNNPIADAWTPEHTYMWVYSQDQFKDMLTSF